MAREIPFVTGAPEKRRRRKVNQPKMAGAAPAAGAPAGAQPAPLNPEDRILVELWAEAVPRMARERRVPDPISPTVYVVSDMEDVARLYLFPKPGARRRVPAAGAGGGLPPGKTRAKVEVEEDRTAFHPSRHPKFAGRYHPGRGRWADSLRDPYSRAPGCCRSYRRRPVGRWGTSSRRRGCRRSGRRSWAGRWCRRSRSRGGSSGGRTTSTRSQRSGARFPGRRPRGCRAWRELADCPGGPVPGTDRRAEWH